MFTILIDTSALLDFQDLDKKARKALKKADNDAGKILYKHIVDEARKKLHSRRDKYIKAVVLEKTNDGCIVSLERSAAWIEDGMQRTDMVPYFLKSSRAKTGENGRYLTVPFNFGKDNKAPTPAQSDLISTIKSELRKRKINYAKIETDETGTPKIGKLHNISIPHAPLKTHDGPGQGHGPIGEVRQGVTGRAFLEKINIYQLRGKDGKVRRSVVSFRTVTSDHSGKLWIHPGLKPANIFKESIDWFAKELDTTIIPRILKDIVG